MALINSRSDGGCTISATSKYEPVVELSVLLFGNDLIISIYLEMELFRPD